MIQRIVPSAIRLPYWWGIFLLLLCGSIILQENDWQIFGGGARSQVVGVSAFSAPAGNNKNNNNIGVSKKTEDNNNNNNNQKNKYAWLDKKRGARYESLNSTVPTATEAAIKVGVEPPLNVSAKAWKRAWIIHRTATPYLHKFDKLAPPDSKLCLMCLWWKALSGNDRKSPVFDDKLHYDMLPSGTRKVLRGPLKRLYPRLHHSNVEIRTAYLNRAVRTAIENAVGDGSDKKKIRLISMGAGYDLRSVKFRLDGLIDQAFELDLPEVVDSKKRLYKERLQLRRPEITDDILPSLYKVNLNQVEDFESTLQEILSTNANDNDNDNGVEWHTIFLFEAVMIYLDEGVPTQLLKTCRSVLGNNIDENSMDATFCFADRLEDIPGADLDIAQPVLKKLGWDIVEWYPKPGLARHMGTLLPRVVEE